MTEENKKYSLEVRIGCPIQRHPSTTTDSIRKGSSTRSPLQAWVAHGEEQSTHGRPRTAKGLRPERFLRPAGEVGGTPLRLAPPCDHGLLDLPGVLNFTPASQHGLAQRKTPSLAP